MDGSAVFVFDSAHKKILLVKRRDVPVWVIPGGGINLNETPEEAAIRETKEESGFDVKIIKKIAEYRYKGKDRKNHIFEAVVVGGKARVNSEAKEICFFDLENLPEIRHPHLSDWILDWKKKSGWVIKREIDDVKIREVIGHVFDHPILVLRFLLMKVGIRVND